MATERVARILLSRGAPFSAEEIAEMPDREGWAWIYANPKPPKPKGPKLTEVCFTGFAPDRKRELVEAAVAAGLQLRTSVTKNLDILCFGSNAGPKKMEKAGAQGCRVLSEEAFLDLYA